MNFTETAIQAREATNVTSLALMPCAAQRLQFALCARDGLAVVVRVGSPYVA